MSDASRKPDHLKVKQINNMLTKLNTENIHKLSSVLLLLIMFKRWCHEKSLLLNCSEETHECDFGNCNNIKYKLI
jgi:hypothetical protein